MEQKQQQQQQQHRLVNAILRVVQLRNSVDGQLATDSCALFVKSWLNRETWSREQEDGERQNAGKFLNWFNEKLSPQRLEAISAIRNIHGGFSRDFLKVSEKLSVGDSKGLNLRALCAETMLRFDSAVDMEGFLTNLANL